MALLKDTMLFPPKTSPIATAPNEVIEIAAKNPKTPIVTVMVIIAIKGLTSKISLFIILNPDLLFILCTS